MKNAMHDSSDSDGDGGICLLTTASAAQFRQPVRGESFKSNDTQASKKLFDPIKDVQEKKEQPASKFLAMAQ